MSLRIVITDTQITIEGAHAIEFSETAQKLLQLVPTADAEIMRSVEALMWAMQRISEHSVQLTNDLRERASGPPSAGLH